MRILVVTPWFPTAASPSSGLFVAREAAALAEVHDVRVLHLDWSGVDAAPPRHDGLALDRIRLSRRSPGDFPRARRLVAEAARDADVTHTHALTGLLPWPRSRPVQGPWVHSEHWSGITAPETLSGPQRLILRAMLPALDRPDVVIAESERLAAAVRVHRSGEVAIVPCVVPEPPAVEPFPADGLPLVAVGGLIPRKGPLLAVGALALLRARGHDARLTWVGDGPQYEATRAAAVELGVVDQVHLTGGLDSAGVAAALDDARLFLLPTRGDNFCVVAAEALTHGRPVVSGAETGAVDYAEPEVSAFVTSASTTAYADAVEDLLARTAGTTPSEVAATVRGRFTPAAVRRGLEDAYRRAGVE
jgi:L-malate glycosyltransferase